MLRGDELMGKALELLALLLCVQVLDGCGVKTVQGGVFAGGGAELLSGYG